MRWLEKIWKLNTICFSTNYVYGKRHKFMQIYKFSWRKKSISKWRNSQCLFLASLSQSQCVSAETQQKRKCREISDIKYSGGFLFLQSHWILLKYCKENRKTYYLLGKCMGFWYFIGGPTTIHCGVKKARNCVT